MSDSSLDREVGRESLVNLYIAAIAMAAATANDATTLAALEEVALVPSAAVVVVVDVAM